MRLLTTLPFGQRRVAGTLIAGKACPTYPEVAEALGLSLGTVHEHLRRIRLYHADVFEELKAERKRQLDQRHQLALERARAHTERWAELNSYWQRF
jgi:predicted transcriptional regulator